MFYFSLHRDTKIETKVELCFIALLTLDKVWSHCFNLFDLFLFLL